MSRSCNSWWWRRCSSSCSATSGSCGTSSRASGLCSSWLSCSRCRLRLSWSWSSTNFSRLLLLNNRSRGRPNWLSSRSWSERFVHLRCRFLRRRRDISSSLLCSSYILKVDLWWLAPYSGIIFLFRCGWWSGLNRFFNIINRESRRRCRRLCFLLRGSSLSFSYFNQWKPKLLTLLVVLSFELVELLFHESRVVSLDFTPLFNINRYFSDILWDLLTDCELLVVRFISLGFVCFTLASKLLILS